MQIERTEPIQVYEAIVEVSGPLKGELSDWPSNIREGVAQAVEMMSSRLSRRVVITKCQCEEDHDAPGHWFIRIECMATLYLVADGGRSRH